MMDFYPVSGGCAQFHVKTCTYAHAYVHYYKSSRSFHEFYVHALYIDIHTYFLICSYYLCKNNSKLLDPAKKIKCMYMSHDNLRIINTLVTFSYHFCLISTRLNLMSSLSTSE